MGYESGNQQILNNVKKGVKLEIARRFTRDCHDLGITIHGTFILGLPGETRETIAETTRFATEIDPHTIQVSIAAPYPGTALHAQASDAGWLQDTPALLDDTGRQVSAIAYSHLSGDDIARAVETVYRRFYFRPTKIAALIGDMARDPRTLSRRLREGVEFFRFFGRRR